MKRNDAFQKKFLSKEDVLNPTKAMIASVIKREVGQGEEMELKVVMEFEGDIKPMVVNATNWDLCETALGPDSDMWIGKTITLYNDPLVAYAGKKIGGVRVRIEPNLTDAQKWGAFLKDNPNVTESIVRQSLGASKPSEWITKEAGRTVEQAIERCKKTAEEAF